MQKIIDFYQDIVLQISNHQGNGSGFYLKDKNIIVTNNHVVEDSREVQVSGKKMEKRMEKVLFFDPQYDIAFVDATGAFDIPEAKLSVNSVLKEGDSVIAIGHPYGFNYSATQGIISKMERMNSGMKYIQIDAAINPGNSGGPLINADGEIAGINSSKIMNAENIGFAIPLNYLKEDLDAFQEKFKGKSLVRCNGCSNVIGEDEIEDEYCPFCGNEIKLPKSAEEEDEVNGIGAIIEKIIAKHISDVRLARKGGAWEISAGNAKINIRYTNNKFIVGDARLCKLPKENIREIYEFMLKENYNLDGLTFSLNKQELFLSFIIFDQDFNVETGEIIFDNMIKKAKEYDEIVINRYKAERIEEDE